MTEGEDKPLKYPSIFFKSALFLMTKVDLLGLVPFDADEAERNARRIHEEIEIVRCSATKAGGLDEWLEWLEARLEALRDSVHAAAASG